MKKVLCILLCCVCTASFAACTTTTSRPSAKNPVHLTIWHTYVEQMGEEFRTLAEEFNSTVGAEQGVVIEIGSVSNASELNERLLDAANGVPGAHALPDMAVIYPQIAVLLAQKGLLADLETHFSEAELAQYVPQFLEEGRLGGEKLYLMPVAKSTEVLFVNRTLFDRFAVATGASMDQLATFEGIINLSTKYYAWSGGKAFYYPDNNFNFVQVGFAQLGEDFLKGQVLNLQAPAFERVWNSYYPPAVEGGVAVFNKYGNYIAMTGDVVCYTNTSAGAIYCPDSVTYADNTKETVEFDVLPYPVFTGGRKVAIQRGGGVCVLQSEQKKEYAAAVFLKWLTAPEQNLRMTSTMGYLPVTTEAFARLRQGTDSFSDHPMIRKMLTTTADMQNSYEFFIPPVFDTYDAISNAYNKALYDLAKRDRELGRIADDAKTRFEMSMQP